VKCRSFEVKRNQVCIINMMQKVSLGQLLIRQKRAKNEVERDTYFSEMSTFDKIDYILELPCHFLRIISIPVCEKGAYDNRLVILWPWFGVIINGMLALGKFPDSIKWFYYIPFAFVWSFLFLNQGFKKGEFEKNSTWKNTIIELIGCLSGFFWTSYVSGLLIDLLTFIGVITKLSPTYLALTIIGVGNALPDALITIQLAKSGKAQMGITGSYAGQLFGLLVGFGLAMMKTALKAKAPVPVNIFPLKSDTLLDFFSILITLTCLAVTFIYGIFSGYNFGSEKNTKLANMLGALYGLFILTSTIVAFKNAYF